MDKSTNLNIRMDKNVKETSEKIFDDLGLNMTTAINMFLRQVIRVNGIPFEIKSGPNKSNMIESTKFVSSNNYKNNDDLGKGF